MRWVKVDVNSDHVLVCVMLDCKIFVYFIQTSKKIFTFMSSSEL